MKSKVNRESLAKFRQEEAYKAYTRDGGLCVFCYFILGKRTPAVDVHHVYGRGRDIESEKEFYTSLVCTCREHHPSPALLGDASNQSWQIAILQMANSHPINRGFKHVRQYSEVSAEDLQTLSNLRSTWATSESKK